MTYEWRYSDKDSCLKWISQHPGEDPAHGASGIVREVAIDRWLNELSNDGFIESTKEFNPYKVKITRRGEAWLKHLDEWREKEKEL